MTRCPLRQLVFLSASFLVLASGRSYGQTPQEPPVSEGGPANGQVAPALPTKLPSGVILINGAEASATDRFTPLPEDGSISKNIYQNRYFGLSYPLSAGWTERVKGPPPSDSGSYVLAQLAPAVKGARKGIVLITAQDLFFARTPVASAVEMVTYNKDHLPSYYNVERPPTQVKIADRSFVRFDYTSPVAQLHWHVLATQIRCHAVQSVFTSQDTAMLQSLIQDLGGMTLPAEAGATSGTGGGDAPVCIPNYAVGDNVIYKVEPVLTDRKFNPIPVRITIATNGKVKHIHLISAFPEQSKAITDAVLQWRFKPRIENGNPVEVETGIMFGTAPRSVRPPVAASQPATSVTKE